jgi:ATP-dependent helicase HrpB
MLIAAAEAGIAGLAAEVAMLLSERGLGGRDTDIERRLTRWRGERGGRAEAARGVARRWAALAQQVTPAATPGPPLDRHDAVAWCIATAFPDRVARRRASDGSEWQSVGGRGYRMEGGSPLAASQWIAIAEAQGAAGGARILSATPMGEALAGEWIAAHGSERRTARYDAAADRVEAVREKRLGAILLSRAPDAEGGADPAALLLAAVRDGGLSLLPWSEGDRQLRARAAFAGVAALGDAALIEALDDWLPPALKGRRRFADIASGALHNALLGMIDWDARQRLDRIAPADYRTPAGSHHAIDYGAEGGPTVTARVQAFFGLERHPTVGDPPVPLVLSLTSPAGRPIQTTRDLPGFWRGSWADVAKEMRGRYPKHPWPDAPWNAAATLRSKRADASRGH